MQSTSNAQPILYHDIARRAGLIRMFLLSSFMAFCVLSPFSRMHERGSWVFYLNRLAWSPCHCFWLLLKLEGKRPPNFLDALLEQVLLSEPWFPHMETRGLPLWGCRVYTNSWPLPALFLSLSWVSLFQRALLTKNLSHSYHVQHNPCADYIWLHLNGAICSPIYLIQCEDPVN